MQEEEVVEMSPRLVVKLEDAGKPKQMMRFRMGGQVLSWVPLPAESTLSIIAAHLVGALFAMPDRQCADVITYGLLLQTLHGRVASSIATAKNHVGSYNAHLIV